MIDDIKNLQRGRIRKIDKNMLVPLIMWARGDIKNYKVCKTINRDIFFSSNNEILLGYLKEKYSRVNYIKTPKANSYNKETFDIVAKYLKKRYHYGNGDINAMRKIIETNIADKNWLESFANEFGLDNKERKKIGISPIKFEKAKVRKNKSLLDI
ncbi:MAG: hypothetical protein ACOC22_00595 [bacterium]